MSPIRVLVNALSATNLSGRHVLLGHLSRLAAWTVGQHEYIVLYHKKNSDICRDLGPNVRWVECPSYTSQWSGRAWWEQTALPRVATRMRIDFMFIPTGTIVPALKLPQVSYAMNPVPFIPGLNLGIPGALKAAVQRWGFRKAMGKAEMMVFLSEYMRQLYRKNTGFTERASEIVYTGIDEVIFKAAEDLGPTVVRKETQIISVSMMAPHKGVEILIYAVERLLRSYLIQIKLLLVGPWPDPKYEEKIRRLVKTLEVSGEVEFKGYASRDELNRHYAESKVFCLMSRSESFGIPSVEAQAFGVPVVSSNCCAIPEVCGHGGIYPEPDDVEGTAKAIAKLLTDGPTWQKLSEAARQNAERYHWDACSRPLLSMFEIVAGEKSVFQGTGQV